MYYLTRTMQMNHIKHDMAHHKFFFGIQQLVNTGAGITVIESNLTWFQAQFSDLAVASANQLNSQDSQLKTLGTQNDHDHAVWPMAPSSDHIVTSRGSHPSITLSHRKLYFHTFTASITSLNSAFCFDFSSFHFRRQNVESKSAKIQI